MEVIIHHSISDLYKTLGLPYEEGLEFTILNIPEIHPTLPFTSPNLRADYFSFILTVNGSGIYYLDDHAFPFGEESFYFTNPGHLKSYELIHSQEAFIIVLSEKFLREYVHPEIYHEFPFLLAEIVPPKDLEPDQLEEFDTLYRQLFNEFHKDSIYRHKILGNLFLILLLKIKESFWFEYNPIEEGNRNSQIVRTFKQLLEQEFGKALRSENNDLKIQAREIAELLNLHPNYLNSVIKNKTGKTVNDWIAERTLSIAKSLLVSSSLSSKEIA